MVNIELLGAVGRSAMMVPVDVMVFVKDISSGDVENWLQPAEST